MSSFEYTKVLVINFLIIIFSAVMHSEGFRYMEESCPSLLSELLQTVASVDDGGLPLSKKRSSSSVVGLDLGADRGNPAESVNPNGRRLRRRL